MQTDRKPGHEHVHTSDVWKVTHCQSIETCGFMCYQIGIWSRKNKNGALRWINVGVLTSGVFDFYRHTGLITSVSRLETHSFAFSLCNKKTQDHQKEKLTLTLEYKQTGGCNTHQGQKLLEYEKMRWKWVWMNMKHDNNSWDSKLGMYKAGVSQSC